MQYSDEELINEIQQLAKELGHPPTLQEFREKGEYAVTTYYDRFGSWREAIASAGYEPREPDSKIPITELIDELQAVANEHGTPPTASQMNEHGAFWASTYRHRFGSWKAAVKAAGFEPSPRSTTIPEEELLTEIRELANRLGKPPTFQEMDNEGNYAARTYVERFGSWNEAIEASGLKTSRHHDITDAELVEELRRLADELGEIPSSRDMDNNGKYGTATYQRHFGSWSSALDVAFEGEDAD